MKHSRRRVNIWEEGRGKLNRLLALKCRNRALAQWATLTGGDKVDVEIANKAQDRLTSPLALAQARIEHLPHAAVIEHLRTAGTDRLPQRIYWVIEHEWNAIPVGRDKRGAWHEARV